MTRVILWCIEQSIGTYVSTIDDLLTKHVRVVSPVEGVPSQVTLSATSRSDCVRSKSSAKDGKLRKYVANKFRHELVENFTQVCETLQCRRVSQGQRCRNRCFLPANNEYMEGVRKIEGPRMSDRFVDRISRPRLDL